MLEKESFFELINRRESCRKYQDRPVEREKLEAMVEAARLAPSACNSQPWSFFVVTRPELRAQAAKTMQDLGMNRWTDQSAAFIVVVEEKATLSATVGSKMKSQDYAQMDIGIATEHLCLAATAMGLSTCIIGWFDEKKLRALLGVPETKRIRLAVSVGYALEDRVREKKRKPASEIATFLE
ncbi:MAG TPA: nitroreductase family protein [Candidatus Fimivivens faecavium]|nr:nitroreductase family protein [Candidatus Fimivivens faecavium]